MCCKQDPTEQINLAIIFYDILVKCLAWISTEFSPVLSQFLPIYPKSFHAKARDIALLYIRLRQISLSRVSFLNPVQSVQFT